MLTPKDEDLEAFKRVAGRPEGVLILEFLNKTMRDVNARLAVTEDSVKLRIFQGQAQAIAILVTALKP